MAVDPETAAAVGVLVAAHAQSRQDTTDSTTRAVEALLRAFDGWYDATAITRMAKHAAASTRAGQKQTLTSTGAYWARLVTLITGRRATPGRLIDPATVRPVPLDAVYGRLADQYRYLTATRGVDTTPEQRLAAARGAWQRRGTRLDTDAVDPAALARSLGQPPTVAPGPLTPSDILDRVIDRGVVVTDDNLSLALRAQLTEAARNDPSGVTGYRRVIRPELSRGGSCGLCIVASARVFKREDLLPLHSRCNCLVIPLIGEAGGDGDIGGAINDADLQAFYDAAGATKAAALKRTRYKVIRHGELGSWLVPADSLVTPLPAPSAA